MGSFKKNRQKTAKNAFSIAFAGVFPMFFLVGVSSFLAKALCPYSAHVFIDVLAKIGDIKNTTSILSGAHTSGLP